MELFDGFLIMTEPRLPADLPPYTHVASPGPKSGVACDFLILLSLLVPKTGRRVKYICKYTPIGGHAHCAVIQLRVLHPIIYT